MPFTAADIAAQMIQQLRVLDPAISAEPGTPERKILDTVAIKVAESQIDLSALQGGLDVDSKFGSNLDKFLALFRFGRQDAVAATGFVTFSRPNAPAPRDISVPTGTRVIAPSTSGDIIFQTTFDVVLRQGTTSIVAPVVAVVTGALGNLAANKITQLVSVDGIYTVTNELPTSGGLDREDDDSVKARFKNTVFRNVSGTTDQYLALAVATPVYDQGQRHRPDLALPRVHPGPEHRRRSERRWRKRRPVHHRPVDHPVLQVHLQTASPTTSPTASSGPTRSSSAPTPTTRSTPRASPRTAARPAATRPANPERPGVRRDEHGHPVPPQRDLRQRLCRNRRLRSTASARAMCCCSSTATCPRPRATTSRATSPTA
jgi:hypothetical protein